MSSLQENATGPLDVVNKRKAPFSRSDSFERLQYTALYSLQLAGTLLTQKSMLKIMEELQYKSRILLEKFMVQIVRPKFKMMAAMVLFWIDAFARYTGINAIFEKKATPKARVEPEKTYSLRVQNRKTVTAPLINTEIKTTDSMEERRLKLFAEFDANARIYPAFAKSLRSSDSDSEMGSNNSISSRQNIGMVVIVYGSATLVYIQLMVLAAFLQTAVIPPGMVFLVSSLGYIGYIVFKMCFVKTKPKDESSSNKVAAKQKSIAPKITTSESTDKPTRLSRSYTRRFLYFHNKTLSKIKLL